MAKSRTFNSQKLLDKAELKIHIETMKKTTLAKLAGITYRQVQKLRTGECRMSLKAAERFEAVTGIKSYKWTHPEEFGNPWRELIKLPEPKKEVK